MPCLCCLSYLILYNQCKGKLFPFLDKKIEAQPRGVGWGDTSGMEAHKGGITRAHIADSFCCTAETDNTVRQLHSNLDSILKSRDITLPTKVCVVKAMVFPVVMYGCESWMVKKAEHRRIDAFKPWCWRRLLRVPWTARRSNQSIRKEISPGVHWKD